LEADGYRVWAAEDVRAAKDALERGRPDLILLDLTLPDGDGLLFCSELREGGNIPIIACSGAMRRSDGVVGLWLGADDFIAKPFNIDNLEARIAAVLRRAARERVPVAHGGRALYRVGVLSVDPARRRATVGGEDLSLSMTQFRLLDVLAREVNMVVGRLDLERAAWNRGGARTRRGIDVHICRLREKLADAGSSRLSITSVRGNGYKLTA
jgi:DNA-binding response OmpR family regulator